LIINHVARVQSPLNNLTLQVNLNYITRLYVPKWIKQWSKKAERSLHIILCLLKNKYILYIGCIYTLCILEFDIYYIFSS
jgi:hypothetical protein